MLYLDKRRRWAVNEDMRPMSLRSIYQPMKKMIWTAIVSASYFKWCFNVPKSMQSLGISKKYRKETRTFQACTGTLARTEKSHWPDKKQYCMGASNCIGHLHRIHALLVLKCADHHLGLWAECILKLFALRVVFLVGAHLLERPTIPSSAALQTNTLHFSAKIRMRYRGVRSCGGPAYHAK